MKSTPKIETFTDLLLKVSLLLKLSVAWFLWFMISTNQLELFSTVPTTVPTTSYLEFPNPKAGIPEVGNRWNSHWNSRLKNGPFLGIPWNSLGFPYRGGSYAYRGGSSAYRGGVLVSYCTKKSLNICALVAHLPRWLQTTLPQERARH